MDDATLKKLYEKDVEIKTLQERLKEQQTIETNRRLAAQLAADLMRGAQSPNPAELWSHLFEQILVKLESK